MLVRFTLTWIFGLQMFTTINKLSTELHMVALASKRLCAGYWVGFSTLNNPEQDPIKMASSCKESGN